MKKTVIVISFALILIKCSKEVIYIDNEPQLEVIVVNAQNEHIHNADVTLFITEDEWREKVNPVSRRNTDIEGKVLFQNLEERIYYFYAQKDTLNNTLGVSYFVTPLKKNEIRVVETIIN
jgi:hypothetical protein